MKTEHSEEEYKIVMGINGPERVLVKEMAPMQPTPEETNLKIKEGPKPLLKPADRIYVFSPEHNTGFVFYDSSPRGKNGEILLEEGVFHSSYEETVEWDESINGKKDNSVPVNDETSLVVHSKDVMAKDANDYKVITIMVSEKVLQNLLKQIHQPKIVDGYTSYKILNFKTKIRNFIFNIFKDDSFDDKHMPLEENDIRKFK